MISRIRAFIKNRLRARKPIVIVLPGKISQEQYDRVKDLVSRHKLILAQYTDLKRAFEDIKTPCKGRGMGYVVNDKVGRFLVNNQLEDFVMEAVEKKFATDRDRIVAEICEIIPDYKLAAANEYGEVEQALDEILEALRAPGVVGIDA